jgi:hypothetical protein
MRKSGQRTGGEGRSVAAVASSVSEGELARSLLRRPKRCSHSGPERYVIVAISVELVKRQLAGVRSSCWKILEDRDVRRASFMPVCGGRSS